MKLVYAAPSREGFHMQRIDPYKFYELGMQIHALERVTKDHTVRSVFFDFWLARFALAAIVGNQIITLDICHDACRALHSAIGSIVPENPENIAAEKLDDKIGEWPADRLAKALKEFETVFAAELKAADVYFVSQKEAYKTPDLIETAEKIFPEEIRKTFSDQTLTDVRHAGRCLAFNLPTAAGFHITRALENVVLEASRKVPGANKPGKHDLHGYIRILEAGGVNAELIAELDRLREKYRNQLMHPETFLSDIEISILVSDVKNVMVKLHITMQNLPLHAGIAQLAPVAAGGGVP